MSATLTQMGPFLMADALFTGHLGPVRKACRLNENGVEFLTVQCIDSALTVQDDFVYRLSHAIEIAVKNPRQGLAVPHELGVVGRQYFVAGEYPEGPTLNRILGRCETLGCGVPVSAAVGLAIRALDIVVDIDGQSGRIWYGQLDLDNVYLNPDGSLSLGWDGIRCADTSSDRDWCASLLDMTEQIIQMLGRLAVASDETDVPDALSDWLRDALSPARRQRHPQEIVASLKTLHLNTKDALQPILDLFSREFAVLNARQQRLQDDIESMPEGTRRRIAKSGAQTLVNHGRQRQIVPASAGRASGRSHVLYEGEMGPLDCARLLYRYSVAGVSGRLELDGSRGHSALQFRRGRLVDIQSTLPDASLREWAIKHELIDRHTLRQNIGSQSTDPGQILRAVVEHGSVGHHQVLQSFEAYANAMIHTLLAESLAQYHFFSDTTEFPFGFGPGQDLPALIAHSLMSTLDQDSIDHFLGPYSHTEISRIQNSLLRLEDLRLSTRQLRAWNAIQEGLPLQETRMRLTAIPGVTHGFAGRIITVLERLDFGRFERTT